MFMFLIDFYLFTLEHRIFTQILKTEKSSIFWEYEELVKESFESIFFNH